MVTADGPRWTRKVRFHADRLTMPLRWRKPRRVFVNAMSDLFHEGLTDAQVMAVFAVMAAAPSHTFQILTKRPERMRDILSGWGDGAGGAVTLKVAFRQALQSVGRRDLGAQLWGEEKMSLPFWPLRNVWLGVSVEDQGTADARIPLLLECPAAVRWVSAEPLLGPVDLSEWLGYAVMRQSEWEAVHREGLDDAIQAIVRAAVRHMGGPRLHWIVAGGESGPGARPMHPDWARSLRDQCRAAGVSYFFKQWGEHRPLGSADNMDDADVPAVIEAVEEATICVYPDGSFDCDGMPDAGGYFMERRGKRRAGRLLDGRTWDEMPGGAS